MSTHWPAILGAIFLACAGCGGSAPVPDAFMKIFTSPGKVSEVRVYQASGEEFIVPADHVANVLEAMQPVSELRRRTKCEAIAELTIKQADAAPLVLLLHTYSDNFAAHTLQGAPVRVEYVGGDAERLRLALAAAQAASMKEK